MVTEAWPCRNADASARTYTVDPATCSPPSRAAEARGDEIVGVWHSHTHTDPYPSPTDVRQAVDPDVVVRIVSLRDDEAPATGSSTARSPKSGRRAGRTGVLPDGPAESCPHRSGVTCRMAVEIKVPTVLRPGRRPGQRGDRRRNRRRGVQQRSWRGTPGLRGNLLDDDGGLHKFVNVYKDDDDIRYLDGLDTKVADGDVLSILPAVAGAS